MRRGRRRVESPCRPGGIISQPPSATGETNTATHSIRQRPTDPAHPDLLEPTQRHPPPPFAPQCVRELQNLELKRIPADFLGDLQPLGTLRHHRVAIARILRVAAGAKKTLPPRAPSAVAVRARGRGRIRRALLQQCLQEIQALVARVIGCGGGITLLAAIATLPLRLEPEHAFLEDLAGARFLDSVGEEVFERCVCGLGVRIALRGDVETAGEPLCGEGFAEEVRGSVGRGWRGGWRERDLIQCFRDADGWRAGLESCSAAGHVHGERRTLCTWRRGRRV